MSATRSRNGRRGEYVEDPDYGSVFQRDDAQGTNRPGFTGEGALSEDTLRELLRSGGQFRISLWTLDKHGRPLRQRNGLRRFRVHIEPPWEGDTDQDEPRDETRAETQEEIIPF